QRASRWVRRISANATLPTLAYSATRRRMRAPPRPSRTRLRPNSASLRTCRGMYEVMRYWDEDVSDWGAAERAYADAWRSRPKWVVSHSLKSVGPNATLVEGDLEAAMRGLKARFDGEIEIAGPVLAGSLTELGLIDEYRIYLRPFVLGRGRPFFTGPRPPLHLVETARIGENTIRLTYVPA